MRTPASKDSTSSYYHHSIISPPRYPQLKEHIEVGTCIVGGGLSGLCTALPLAENGYSVALIEAARIGSGASGHSGGQILSDYACGMGTLERQAGSERALWFWQQSLAAVELVDERIRKYRIECDWTRGYATVAIRPRHLEALEEWQEKARRQYGITHLEMWDKTALQQQLASERYLGGLYDPLSGHLHPLNYTLGIARAAAASGAHIYENTPFISMEPAFGGWLVHTPAATIQCDNVVLAVNTFAGKNRNRAFRRLDRKALSVSTFMIATEPLGTTAQTLIRNNMAACDNRYILDYYRLSADGRLLFGGKDSEFIYDAKRMTQAVRRDMLKVFPQLENARIDFSWGGDCDITPNLTPHFGRQAANLYFLQGYCGHGMAITGIAGLAVAEAILGDSSRLRPFEQLRHRSILGGKPLRKAASFVGSSYYRFQDARR
ncbi:oxidoreductase [Neisseria arctica]|uniref:Oxidoreductase n=1 Tax=Neisseria arctica TaxID=1470200 RepID=A0A0J0YST1_9NEIS|nr:FAD-binding oxidoreductase [Neisseria arctica]KLT73166.1 oxidoreductase [Neisseria arctica]UOO87101.1 FAD-binding oxidoreductase [Neisseria arctica]